MILKTAASALGYALTVKAAARAERQAADAQDRMALRLAYQDCPHPHWLAFDTYANRHVMVVERPPTVPRVPRNG